MDVRKSGINSVFLFILSFSWLKVEGHVERFQYNFRSANLKRHAFYALGTPTIQD